MSQLAALYARVSTLQQEDEATIDSQVAAVEAFARNHDYVLSPDLYFLDRAVSGYRLDRPALDRLRDLAAAGLFPVVLCLDVDRLARKYAHQWLLVDELQRQGIRVVFVSHPAMDDTPQGQLLLGVQGLFAEYERAMITERLRRGKLYRIRQGRLVNPVPPYGYRYIHVGEPNGGQWEIHPVEAAVVRQIYLWYTDHAGLPLWQIVKRLEGLGPEAPPRGAHWRYSTVQAILTQPAYTGRTHYNRTQTCQEAIGQPKKHGRGVRRSVSHVPRSMEEWIAVQVPALVDEETWQRAQERLVMKRKFAQRNNNRRFYLLRGLLVCDVCGRTLIGRSSRGTAVYHCTHGGQDRPPDVPPHRRVIASAVVEPVVWEAVSELLRNPILLADAWESQQDAQAGTPDEAARLQARLKTLTDQWERLVDLFQDGTLSKDDLARRKARLDEERAGTERRLAAMTRQADQQRAKEQMLQDFTVFCEQIETRLASPTPALQQEVIRLLIDHIVVEENEIVIKHIIPTDDDCRLLPGRR